MPRILISYISSFPTLLIISKDDWIKALKDSSYLPTVYVYGYYYSTESGKPVLEGREFDSDKMDADKILNWVRSILDGKPYAAPVRSLDRDIAVLNSGQTIFRWN